MDEALGHMRAKGWLSGPTLKITLGPGGGGGGTTPEVPAGLMVHLPREARTLARTDLWTEHLQATQVGQSYRREWGRCGRRALATSWR